MNDKVFRKYQIKSREVQWYAHYSQYVCELISNVLCILTIKKIMIQEMSNQPIDYLTRKIDIYTIQNSYHNHKEYLAYV